ncbi:immunoglobulin-binding protein 1 isoform X5 [Strigops habroptila]|uniref:immunoglobulin-binding protein 1 isoform X5 n=1 Tax=Strigops habroptila TaxID=2489341 RepID=UPI0011CFB63B|nr:immunoglobulin-binding protein 1 isoform X5 [Strigops habroptila]
MAEGAEEGQRLAELLAAGWQLWEELETGTAPSSGALAVQEKVRQGLDVLQRANSMVAQLDLFSENEDLEEIASADLKYLLLPALLGAMTLKQVDLSKRLEHLETARAHFWSFLKLCKSYGLGSFHLPPATSPPAEEGAGSPPRRSPAAAQAKLVAMASSRQAKIERVFGAGYPSLPVMTVDDWYDQRRKQGVVPGQSTPQRTPAGLTDEELQKQQQEKKEEEDDEEALQKARNWDDWKDTHPRGYGNRHNMG